MPVAELTAVLTADNSQFNAALDDSVKKAKKSGKEIETVWSKISKGGVQAVAGALAFGSITAVAKELADFAGDIEDMSATLSTSTDQFQKWSFAISQSGGNQEVFVKTMVALGQSIEDAKNDTGKAGEAFVRLGITLDDLNTKDKFEVFLMMADAIKNGGAEGENFSAIADLIGLKVASKMIPSLKDGSAAFLELGESAGIASKEAIAHAAKAQDFFDSVMLKVKTFGLNAFHEWFDPAELRDPADLPVQSNSPAPWDEQKKEIEKGVNSFSDLGVSSRIVEGASELVSALERGKKAAEEMKKDAQSIIDDENERWEKQSKAYQDLQNILYETSDIERETARSKMSSSQLMLDLEKQRVELLKQARWYESDIFGLHFKDAALTRQQIARVEQRQSQLFDADRSTAAGIGVSSNRDMNDKLGFGALALGPIGTNAGVIGGGGLTSGGLTSGGGMGEAWGMVRSGDAARAKLSGKKEKDPQLEVIEKNTADLVNIWRTPPAN